MTYKFTNYASTTLAAGITSAATTITLASGGGSLFPSLSAGDYFYGTLVDSSNNLEIVLVTARSTDTLTVTRAQDGSAARAFLTGDKFELRVTAAFLGGLKADAKAELLAATNSWAGVNTFTQNMAIGTTLGAWNSGYNAWQLGAGASIATASDLSVTVASNAIVVAGGGSNYQAAGYATRWKQLNGVHTFSTAVSGAAAGAITWVDVAMISSGGMDITGTITTKGAAAAFYMIDRTTSTNNWALYSQSNIVRLYSGVAGATGDKFTFDSTGSFIATGNVTGYSDERLKTNWRVLGQDFITSLANVKSGIYDRVDCDLTQIGVSAQSLREVMPDAVHEDLDGMLSVSYGNAALAACVELAKRVVALEKELAALKG
jgi:hypothetical protein